MLTSSSHDNGRTSMKFTNKEIDVRTNPIRATYLTDCFRRVEVKTDEGKVELRVKRWVQEHQVEATVSLVPSIPAVFFRGAKIA